MPKYDPNALPSVFLNTIDVLMLTIGRMMDQIPDEPTEEYLANSPYQQIGKRIKEKYGDFEYETFKMVLSSLLAFHVVLHKPFDLENFQATLQECEDAVWGVKDLMRDMDTVEH